MKPKALQSRHNPTVKRFLKILGRPEKYAPSLKNPSGEVVVEGPGPLETALEAGCRISSVLITGDTLEDRRCESLIERLTDLAVPVYVVEKDLMSRLSDTAAPQGIMAICTIEARGINDVSPGKGELLAVSDSLQDPGNTGTIIRVCDAAGIRIFVSLKGSVNPFNPKAVRASAGSVFNLDIVFSERGEFLRWCRSNDIPLLVTAPDAEMTIYEFDPRDGGAVVFGNERAGVSTEMKRAASCSLRVPIYGRAESLNVASSAAIILYEFRRKEAAEQA